MKIGIAILVAVSLLILFVMSWDGRSQPEYHHSDADWAKGCRTTIDKFRQASAKAVAGEANSSMTVGRCKLTKTANGSLTLDVIETGQAT